MAVTAQLTSLTNTVCDATQNLRFVFVLTNSAGGTPVNVNDVQPFILQAGTASAGTNNVGAVSNAPINIGSSRTLGASATAPTSLSIPFDAVVYSFPAPRNPIYPSSSGNQPATPVNTVTIGANAFMSDGTQQSASMTVFVYPLIQDNTLTISTPIPFGSQRFDSNMMSPFESVVAALAFRYPQTPGAFAVSSTSGSF